MNWCDSLIGQIERQAGKEIVFWRTDRAKEFQGKLFQSMLSKHRITQETGIPYAHHQMGKVERANRTIINTVRTMLIDTKLPQALWPELAKTAVYLRNRSLTKTLS